MKTADLPIPITRGEGVYLFDEAGKSYIDAISSWWVNLHGHAHPYLAEKIYKQALTIEHLIFAGFTHEPAVSLAERLLTILPGKFDKIFYSDNGSTAVEVALKMAIQYWMNMGTGSDIRLRKKILAFRNSYHGDTFGAMSVSERGLFTFPFKDYLFEVEFIDLPDTGNLEDLRAVIRANRSELCCFIYEPLVQGAGGMKIYSPDPLDELISECRQHQIICIADEVMTGFGRTGKLFASSFLKNSPDIICLSKGITGGMLPLGATACTNKIFNAFLSDDRSRAFFHGHSYTANPIACAAANASLDLLLMEDCQKGIELISRMHSDFMEKLIKAEYKLKTSNHRQIGTIMAFEIENEKGDNYLSDIGRMVSKVAAQHGVLLRPLGNTVYLMPPYCISADQLRIVYGLIEMVLN